MNRKLFATKVHFSASEVTRGEMRVIRKGSVLLIGQCVDDKVIRASPHACAKWSVIRF